MPRSRIDSWIRSGRLRALHRGVYAFAGAVIGVRGELRAALLAAGPEAALSWEAAAFHLQLIDQLPRQISVSVPRGRRCRLTTVRVHHPVTLDPQRDITMHAGLRCTTAPRTLLDLATTASRERLERMIERAELHQRLDRDALASCLARAGRATGIGRLRAAIGPDRLDAALVESRFERVLLQAMLEAGLPRPILQQPFELDGYEDPIRVDYCWPSALLAGEADGPHHERPAQARRDARRDRALALHGWHVVRVPLRAYERDPTGEVERVRHALAAPPASLG